MTVSHKEKAVPVIPELVRYEFSEGVGEYVERADGEYVRYDQAAEIIAELMQEKNDLLNAIIDRDENDSINQSS